MVSIQSDSAHLVLWVRRSFPANALPAIEQFLDVESALMHAYLEQLTEGSYCNHTSQLLSKTKQDLASPWP